MSKHFSWDYEESSTQYYHIYDASDIGEEMMSEGAIILDLPQTEENDRIVDSITQALESLAEENKAFLIERMKDPTDI